MFPTLYLDYTLYEIFDSLFERQFVGCFAQTNNICKPICLLSLFRMQLMFKQEYNRYKHVIHECGVIQHRFYNLYFNGVIGAKHIENVLLTYKRSCEEAMDNFDVVEGICKQIRIGSKINQDIVEKMSCKLLQLKPLQKKKNNYVLIKVSIKFDNDDYIAAFNVLLYYSNFSCLYLAYRPT